MKYIRSAWFISRWPVLFALHGILCLCSCTAVDNRLDRYESNYQHEYAATIQDQNNPGVIHCEDEYVAMDLVMRDVKLDMDIRIVNRTGGSVSISWPAVLFELAKGPSAGTVPEGGNVTVIPAMGQSRNRVTPDRSLSLFAIDAEESQAHLGSTYADNRVVIRVPVQVEAIGETKIYLFTYKYRSGIVDLSGDCARMN
jgi:hypothetical protein